ncbi:tRNA (mnm(5)s(2)U34)-methyltransferase [Levilactobacillus tujiorum]|uniref:Methyltransferase domain-containing protein n=1 Tax=Levilactobacillus tujiorum TaxID=2912243 RepID=A0ABX1L384_9LACO|nr:class I SAM-dependent methyltransferase [Levilactobacillus tujiorum]MCH5464506.1 methyltransferase domain-containing protein [Levilactobacillus tujiorum]NLR12889.1 methyltransferase domain-containing protein [Lactobacillus sp. HBUAS51387]NLR29486.1 methyltransferase domain-containing protein [Levilactobacillus tujiorum]
MNLPNALAYSHTLLSECVGPGDTVVDATVGNGHDTLFLANLVGHSGRVIGFDIQPAALQETQTQLNLTGLAPQVSLHAMGHEHVGEFLTAETQVAGAIFNLGYLPGGDKSLITHPSTTLTAVKALLDHLHRGGRVILVVYSGHPGGLTERDAVLDFCQQLPQKSYQVLQYGFINQIHHPPFLLAIERR